MYKASIKQLNEALYAAKKKWILKISYLCCFYRAKLSAHLQLNHQTFYQLPQMLFV